MSIKALYAPDEPAHLETVMEIRNKHVLPEVHYTFTGSGFQVLGTPGDEAAREFALRLGFPNTFKVFPYESVQPPLYYLTAALASKAVSSDAEVILLASRLVSSLFGAGAVYFCWATINALAPSRRWWAIASAGCMMLLPQFCFNTASVSNDSAVNFAGALTFYVWFRGLRQPAIDPWMLKAGAVTGLAILAKLSALTLVPALVLLVLCRVLTSTRPEWHARLKKSALLGGGAAAAVAAVCGWWLIRNLLAYGEISGTREANKIYTQLLPSCAFAAPGEVSSFIRTTYESTLGRFGWMDIRLPDLFYTVTALLLLLFAVLSALVLAQHMKQKPSAVAVSAVAVSMLAGVALVIGFMQYNLSVSCQPQGRFFLLLLTPASAFLTFGPNAAVQYKPLKIASVGVLFMWLALLNVQGLMLVSSIP